MTINELSPFPGPDSYTLLLLLSVHSFKFAHKRGFYIKYKNTQGTCHQQRCHLIHMRDLVHGTVFFNSSSTAYLAAPLENISRPIYSHYHNHI